MDVPLEFTQDESGSASFGISAFPQPPIDERPKPLACFIRRRYSLHDGMLPEGRRRQPKEGASQTFSSSLRLHRAPASVRRLKS
jgi:hypothetical protein